MESMRTQNEDSGDKIDAPEERRNLETRPFGDSSTSTSAPETASSRPSAQLFGVQVTRIIELVIGLVAVPVLAYLAVTVTRLDTTVTNANLPQLASDVSNTKDRVGRIFDAFPEMRARIAEERLNARVSWALLALRRSSNNMRVVHLVDLESGKSTAFSIRATDAANRRLNIVLRGLAANLDDDPTSLSRYQMYLAEAKRPPLIVPAYLDENLSFAIDRNVSPAEYKEAIELFTEATDARPITRTYASSFANIDMLLKDVVTRRPLWAKPEQGKKNH